MVKWVWTGEVVFLVAKYNFQLPTDFFETIKVNEFIPPRFSRQEMNQLFFKLREIGVV